MASLLSSVSSSINPRFGFGFMTTKISKILVVFVTACSLAFMGFTLAMSNSGPDWRTEAEDFEDYIFTFTPGENATWGVRHRSETAPLKSSKNLADLVAAAYQDGTSRNNTAKQAIDQKQPDQLRERTKLYEAAIKADTIGVDVRTKQLTQMYVDACKEIDNIATAGDKRATLAIDILNQASRRRESVFRLTREREEIETEHFRLKEQKRLLLDLLHQMRGIRLRLENREQQLIDQGGRISDDSAAPSA